MEKGERCKVGGGERAHERVTNPLANEPPN